ncbi:MAG: hypothetical protein FJ057_07590 [Cyanobacteria bacterium K_DeepCast_0m_m1_088]|nr:hypothetical protein [Cyanobacteria bacterium K_DeepCast_0m_m1_088]
MKKREMLLNALRWLLLGEREEPEPPASEPSTPVLTLIESSIPEPPVAAMPTPEAASPQPAPAPSADQFPTIDAEIKDLLASADWEEVNQGLELLVSALGSDAIQPLVALVDVSALRVQHPSLWQVALGISSTHEINAVAKLAELTGALAEVRSIRLNQAAYADQIQLDLSLLAGAGSLEQLIVNGGCVTGLSALGELSSLRHLALVSESIDWDTDEHAELFVDLADLRSLCLNQWPWDDLSPLGGLSQLERLDLRGGELSSLEGLEALASLSSLSLSDFYSLSEISEIGNLSQLRTLRLLSLSVTSLEGLEGLQELSSIELEGSDLVDVSALGSLPRLATVRMDCSQELVGLGSLATTGSLRQLKLANMPDYSYGDASNQRFGRREMDRLCMSWKAVEIKTGKVSSVAAEGADLPVVLLGVSVLETLSGQIDAAAFSERLDRIASHWGAELRSRAYWPGGAAAEGYSQTAPIGQWLNRASGSVAAETLEQIASALSGLLPAMPQRA